jgi:hypothetical protein
VILKCLAACPAKSFTVLLEALLDGVIALRQLISAKPRRIARASLPFLRRALSGLRSRIATSQNQRGNGYQNNSAHCFLQGNRSIPLEMVCDGTGAAAAARFLHIHQRDPPTLCSRERSCLMSPVRSRASLSHAAIERRLGKFTKSEGTFPAPINSI